MNVHPTSSRAGVAAAVTALLLCTSLAAAAAASSAQATSTTAAATSGSWGAVATTSTAAPYGTGPVVLNFPNGGTTGQGNGLKEPAQFFTVGNSGTLSLASASYTVQVSDPTVTFSVDACSTGWDEANNSCSTSFTVLINKTASVTSSTVATVPGTGIRLRARLTSRAPNNTKVTVNVDVTRDQVRAATTTSN